MLSYIARKLLAAIPVLWGVATLVFVVMRLLPGDPAAVMLAEGGGSAEAVARLRAELGFDDPLSVQYGRYLLHLLQGDLGTSLFTGRPVTTTIGEQLPATVELAVASVIVALVVGTALGTVAAYRHGTWLEVAANALAITGVSVPIFWSSLLLMWLLSLRLGWLPSTGHAEPGSLVMPALVLGFASAGAIGRLVRASLLEVLAMDYVNTARAKGLGNAQVLVRHAIKNAFIPVVTIVGLQFGFLIGGTVVTETIFARPGIGRLMVNAILWKDFPVVQGVALLAALAYTLVNLGVDLAYAYLDPRIHYD
ncbi:MAG: ABC transporter permease [Anaerolineae bacterium]|nr:ABC transporter permease [Anaerolineae bacterium]